MAKSRSSSDAKEPAGFKPRRTIGSIGEPDEKRIVVRAYMPASLAKDIALYAIERDCSVSDLLNTILRKAIPSLKVVTIPGKTSKAPYGERSASDDDIANADLSLDTGADRTQRPGIAAA